VVESKPLGVRKVGRPYNWAGVQTHQFGNDPLVAYHNQRVCSQTPSERLRLAVLEEAVVTLRKGPGIERSVNAYRDTVLWIRGRVTSAPSFSLREICMILELDHQTVIQFLEEIVAENKRKLAA
jgi:hypothetical protein